ncbi:unnamed protein product [Cylicocyclus nassatus]|uniref:Uncharacterized protein n=1 Tax=Cylicocyclus nassatus TaxID=53992 RepID=A0AA36H1L4_CYLNA|nr:unnamed protein product [Cylicocyclus nassatus]
MTPNQFSVDALHICSEGATRDRFLDTFTTKSKFIELRVSRDGLESVKQSLRKIASHTYASNIVLSLEDLTHCKARELDEVASCTPVSRGWRAGVITISGSVHIRLLGVPEIDKGVREVVNWNYNEG